MKRCAWIALCLAALFAGQAVAAAAAVPKLTRAELAQAAELVGDGADTYVAHNGDSFGLDARAALRDGFSPRSVAFVAARLRDATPDDLPATLTGEVEPNALPLAILLRTSGAVTARLAPRLGPTIAARIGKYVGGGALAWAVKKFTALHSNAKEALSAAINWVLPADLEVYTPDVVEILLGRK